jgi:hypothetical protein
MTRTAHQLLDLLLRAGIPVLDVRLDPPHIEFDLHATHEQRARAWRLLYDWLHAEPEPEPDADELDFGHAILNALFEILLRTSRHLRQERSQRLS